MDYQIAICDDNKYFLDALKSSLQKYAQLNALSFQIFAYSNGEALLTDYQSHRFNLLILDMEMPGQNGIEVALEIRRFDNNVDILYITIHEDFSMEAFAVDATAYLVKPLTDERLFEKLDRIFRKLRLQASFHNFQDTHLSLESKKDIIQLSYSEIMYISKRRNSLTIHTTTEERTLYMNIKDISKLLDASIFVKINPGQIVNWTKVTHLDDNLIYLEDIELAISRSYIAKLNKRYRQEIVQSLRAKEYKRLDDNTNLETTLCQC